MNLLTAEKISRNFTDKVVLNQVSLGINKNDKIGVIGVNGTGKSTLLKILAGKEEPDEGRVVKGNDVRIEYLAQTPEFDDKYTVLENVIKSHEHASDGWNVEGEAKVMLGKLGITDWNEKPSNLSGGQRKRAALVRTLLTPADILILDEPTNHLDNAMAEWLEDYLNRFNGAFIMITHDRYFLDKVTNKIVEIDKGNLYTYETNYSGFLELKLEREEMELATERKKKALYRQDLAWIMRGARARSTKQKAHIQRFEELRDREKIEEVKNVEITALASRLGKKTIELKDICKAFDEKILIKDFSYIFLKTDRIGIVGGNGAGKSTLLKIVTGIEQADSGSIEIGPTVKIGYFSQECEKMNGKQKVIDYIKEVAEYIETSEGSASASQMLERFLFTGAMQYSLIEKLSGGERRRLYLLKILMEAPNVLILDEPTNDLDIQTLRILEDYLDTFPGIVITVSHDRYFLDRVVRRIFAFEGNGEIRQYEGGFTDYWLKTREKEKTAVQRDTEVVAEKKTKKNYNKNREKKLKFTYAEQKEFETIDEDIATLEEQLDQIEKDILANAKDFVKLQELTDKKDEIQQQLDHKMERWVYLNDLAEQIQAEKA
ncbi:aBC transporter related [Clostridium sp. CAG:411]|jgi:ATP-binding cassette subfamily F protein uup|nr:ABC-F family ATP-binding cassette domain-containing protein [Lachnospiraceae bacterium]CDE46055.1 aBC transporter related [Clostridium sp. CAG:411]